MIDAVVGPGRVVTPSGIVSPGRVLVEGDRIVAVEHATREPPDDRLILPGLVDLHGDDLERHLFPRPGAKADVGLAFSACDRANAAAGITTKYHAVAFEDAPDDQRSLALASSVVDAMADAEGLLVDNRVHARCELSNADAAEAVRDALGRDPVDLVSLMRHVPGEGQFDDESSFHRRYVEGRDCTEEAADRVAAQRRRSAESLDARAARLVETARTAGVAVASHDDEDPATVERLSDLGVGISEFPVTMDAAERAAERGLTTAMAAPNLVRGGSMWGNLDAEAAVDAGVLDALCSDYHPPSLLAAPFVDTGEPLPRRVRRVTAAPASAAGLDDRGRIQPGARADLVVVDPEPVPSVRRTLRAGADVYRARSGDCDAGADRQETYPS
jgi:alpha-D-ribose 1-methylphosphonate 5-triphosphate diphosphatase